MSGFAIHVRSKDAPEHQISSKREILQKILILIKLMASGRLEIQECFFSPPENHLQTWVLTIKGKGAWDGNNQPPDNGTGTGGQAGSPSQLDSSEDLPEGTLFRA